MSHTIPLHEKITASIRGCTIGDALGLPVETRTKEKIAHYDLHSSPRYLPISLNTYFCDGSFSADASGITSDDTALTLAALESITLMQGIDLPHLFAMHKKYFDLYEGRGFGDFTRMKLETYIPGVTPISHLQNISTGNGVLMKLAPYAAYFAAKQIAPKVQESIIDEIARTTHNTPIVRLCAILHNHMLVSLFQSQPETLDLHHILSQLLHIAHQYEHERNMQPPYSSEGHMLASPIIEKLLVQRQAHQEGNMFDYQKILDTHLVSLDQAELNTTMKPGFHAAATLGIVYACFLVRQDMVGLMDAICIGYDTDTQGAVMGAMVGALCGKFYDEGMVEGIIGYTSITQIMTEYTESLGV